jgi:hypothetical protein
MQPSNSKTTARVKEVEKEMKKKKDPLVVFTPRKASPKLANPC